jgi:intraflagellar transport protein 52
MKMIIFDVSKGETHHSNANFTILSRRLRSNFKVQVNKESLTPTRLKECELLVIASPQSQFTDEELCVLKDYVDGGGSLAVFSSEGGTEAPQSNLNELTRMFGISIDKTTLVRAVYCNYLHPKHALIQNGIVQPEIGVEKFTPMNAKHKRYEDRQNNMTENFDGIDASMSLSFVYPNGTTRALNPRPAHSCRLGRRHIQSTVRLPLPGSQ